MTISYFAISTFTAFLCAVLSASLLLVPELIYWIFGIAGNNVADFMSRRAAMLFVGLAIIVFLSRRQANSPLRQNICFALSMSFSALAFLGIYEFARQFAGIGIWLAIITELALAFGYAMIWKENAGQS